MKEYLENVNQKTLFFISLIGIIGTLSLYMYWLFIPTDYRILLIISITIFTYIFCISQKANSSQLKSFVSIIFLIAFILVNFTDFYFEYHYTKNDWEASKGYVDNVVARETRHSPDIIHYHFYDQNKKYESTKSQSLMLNIGFRESDSIYVVYSKSNPSVNDIYLLESGPNLHDSEYFILYFIKNNSLFKWTIILVTIWLLFKFFSNRKNGYYPIKK